MLISILTVEETAALCGVSVAPVYRWMELNRIEWLYHAGGFFEAAFSEPAPLPWPSRFDEALGSLLLHLRG